MQPLQSSDLIPELVHRRTMASVPFGGRYRMIDFTLSAMVNAGIDNVKVLAKKNYYSLMDHLGNAMTLRTLKLAELMVPSKSLEHPRTLHLASRAST